MAYFFTTEELTRIQIFIFKTRNENFEQVKARIKSNQLFTDFSVKEKSDMEGKINCIISIFESSFQIDENNFNDSIFLENFQNLIFLKPYWLLEKCVEQRLQVEAINQKSIDALASSLSTIQSTCVSFILNIKELHLLPVYFIFSFQSFSPKIRKEFKNNSEILAAHKKLRFFYNSSTKKIKFREYSIKSLPLVTSVTTFIYHLTLYPFLAGILVFKNWFINYVICAEVFSVLKNMFIKMLVT